MRPCLDHAGQQLVDRRYGSGLDSAIQHQVETAQVDSDRFVRMVPARVLYGVSIDCELMHLTEKHRIGVFRLQHFRVQTPAFWR